MGADGSGTTEPRPLGRRPGWRLTAGAVFLTALLGRHVIFSDPCTSGGAFAWSLGLLLLALVCAGLVVRVSRRRLLAASILAVLLAGHVALNWNDVPFQLRWALSRSAFEARAAAPASVDAPSRVGLFEVTRQSVQPNGAVRFVLPSDGCCLICLECGLLRLPAGVSAPSSTLSPLGGGWYRFADCT